MRQSIYKGLDWKSYTDSDDGEEEEMEPLWDDDDEEDSEAVMCQEEQLSEEDYEPESEAEETNQVRYTATPEDASSASEQWRLRMPDGMSYGSEELRVSDEDKSSGSADGYGSSADGDVSYHDRRSTDTVIHTDQLNTTIPDGRMGNAIPMRRGSRGFSNLDRGDEPILGRESGTDKGTTAGPMNGRWGGA
jgi:hypothetical protein